MESHFRVLQQRDAPTLGRSEDLQAVTEGTATEDILNCPVVFDWLCKESEQKRTEIGGDQNCDDEAAMEVERIMPNPANFKFPAAESANLSLLIRWPESD